MVIYFYVCNFRTKKPMNLCHDVLWESGYPEKSMSLCVISEKKEFEQLWKSLGCLTFEEMTPKTCTNCWEFWVFQPQTQLRSTRKFHIRETARLLILKVLYPSRFLTLHLYKTIPTIFDPANHSVSRTPSNMPQEVPTILRLELTQYHAYNNRIIFRDVENYLRAEFWYSGWNTMFNNTIVFFPNKTQPRELAIPFHPYKRYLELQRADRAHHVPGQVLFTGQSDAVPLATRCACGLWRQGSRH